MRLHVTAWLILATMLISVSPATAAVPRLINFQGSLTDANGHPLDGEHVVTFRIYYVLQSGTPKWEETQVVSAYEGLFHTLLGGTTVLPDTLFEHEDLWMGLQVDGDPEMMPRMKLATVPWAFRAAVAETSMTVTEYPVHDHDDRYYTETELNTNDGTVNEPSDPVDWTKIKSVPADFADGVDDLGDGDITGVAAGDGLVGGGDDGDVTLDVGAGDGVTVSSDLISLDTGYADARYVNEGDPTGYQLMDFVTYTGDGTDNRSILHGLGRTPALIFIIKVSGGAPGNSQIWCSAKGGDNAMEFGGDTWYTNRIQGANASNFQVGSDGRTNQAGKEYLAVLHGDD